jgi:CBS domain-containing protein
MLAKDIMTREVISVRKDTPVVEAMNQLLKNRITGMPVVDDEGNLVGIVSEADLIYKEESILPLSAYWMDKADFVKACRKAIASSVEEAMTSRVYSVSEETPIEDIATVMIEKGIKRVPVVRGRKVVGIISRADVMKAIVAEWPEVLRPSW